MDVLKFCWWTLVFVWRCLMTLGKFLAWCLPEPKSTTLGDARWANHKDLKKAGAFDGKHAGLIAGKFNSKIIRMNGEGAMMVYARQGAGKGAGIIIPNLLEYDGAVFVTDPKGENYAITQRQRRTLTGGPVYRLNLEDTDQSHHFNPLDIVRVHTSNEKDDAETLASLLVKPDAKGAEFWDKQAVAKFGAMILHVCQYYQDQPLLKNLATLRNKLNSGRAERRAFLDSMIASKSDTVRQAGYALLEALAEPDEGETPSGSGELGTSIMSTIEAATNLWTGDSGPGRISKRSDFDFMKVIEQKGSVFFIIPEEKISQMGPFLRVMLGCTTMAIQRYKKAGLLTPDKPKPLIVFDECATLGRMEQLLDFMGWMRTYAKAILVFQDRGQIERRYNKEGAKTLLNACRCKITFDINDNDTAREWSEKIGQRTVQTRSAGHSQASHHVIRHQNQSGTGESGYALLDTSQIQRMEEDELLIDLHNLPVIRAQKIKYWQEKRWRGVWDEWIEHPLSSDASAADDALPLALERPADAGAL